MAVVLDLSHVAESHRMCSTQRKQRVWNLCMFQQQSDNDSPFRAWLFCGISALAQ